MRSVRWQVFRVAGCVAGLLLTASACGDDAGADSAPSAETGDDQLADANGNHDAVGCADWLDGRTGDFIIPYDPGGSTDPIGREFVDSLQQVTNQQWNVENISGAGGSVGTADLLSREPDGTTLGLSSNSALGFQPLMNDDTPYDSHEDASTIIKLADIPGVLAVQAEAPWDTLDEFIQSAADQPGELAVSTSGNLSQLDQNLIMLEEEAGIELVRAPFSGGAGEAITAALGGQVDAAMVSGPGILGQVEAGEMRALGVTGSEIYEPYPEATPFEELGYNVATPAWYGIFGPKDIPSEELDCIRERAFEAASTPEFEEWAANAGYVFDPLPYDDAIGDLSRFQDEYQYLYDNYGHLASD